VPCLITQALIGCAGESPFDRFYGPETPLFDKSWTMPDIEKVN